MEIKNYIEKYDKFLFFWQTSSPFSQWHPSVFKSADGIEYQNAEQYMMHSKALAFHDQEIAKQILDTSDPRKIKALGKKVKNFDSEVWDKLKIDTVYNANYLKFTQDPKLLQALLETDGLYLVEASPYDNIWGVGLKADDPRILDYKKWKGENLLGNILTKLREYLLKKLTVNI